MNPTTKATLGLLILLGVLDLATAPAMLATHGKNGPPGPAAFINIALGLATLVGVYGLTQGARWGTRLTIGVRAIDWATSILAFGATIGVFLRAADYMAFVGSVVAVVLVARLLRAAVPLGDKG